MSRPPHLVTPAEASAWLAGSAVKTVTVHRTDPEAAQDIVEHGVDITRATPDSAWGQGFYSCTISDPAYGTAEVMVAIRLQRPLVIQDSIRDAAILEDLTTRAGTDDFREAVLAAGFYGVMVHFGGNRWWVVAYHGEQVKVVLPDEDDA